MNYVYFAMLCWWGGTLFAQNTNGRRLELDFPDPDRTGRLILKVKWGNLTVNAHSGKKVIIERLPLPEEDSDQDTDPLADGLKKVAKPPPGFKVSKQANSLTVRPERYSDRRADFNLTVPAQTSLSLKVVIDGNISITGVEGEIEAEAFVGSMTLEDVSGPIVAYARDGDLKVSFAKPPTRGPMMFTSVYGNVEAFIQPETKAILQVKSDHGDVYCGLAVTFLPETETEKSDSYQAVIGDLMVGRLNGGGPLLRFKNNYGNIYIRKKPSP